MNTQNKTAANTLHILSHTHRTIQFSEFKEFFFITISTLFNSKKHFRFNSTLGIFLCCCCCCYVLRSLPWDIWLLPPATSYYCFQCTYVYVEGIRDTLHLIAVAVKQAKAKQAQKTTTIHTQKKDILYKKCKKKMFIVTYHRSLKIIHRASTYTLH